MIGPLHPEVLLAAGYSVFLVLAAAGLEWFGRHSHRHSGQFRTSGFSYHVQLDVWECPCGHHLHRHAEDPIRRTVRYRAAAHACNACARKADCTDSDQGREITVSVGSWIASEAGRFHRGMSLLLLVLAAFLLVVEMFRCQTTVEFLALGSVLAPVVIAKLRLLRGFLPGRSPPSATAESR
jgi:hypothetical protein